MTHIHRHKKIRKGFPPRRDRFEISFPSRREAAMALHAGEMHSALFDLTFNLPKRVKWIDPGSMDGETAAERVLGLVFDEIENLPIGELDEILS